MWITIFHIVTFLAKTERRRHVPHKDPPVSDQNAHHIEPIRLPAPPMSVDPTLRRFHEFSLLATVHRFNGIAELLAVTGLHFHERNHPFALGHDIDIAAARLEPTRHNPPSTLFEPPGGDALPQFSEGIGRCCHGRTVQRHAGRDVIIPSRPEPFHRGITCFSRTTRRERSSPRRRDCRSPCAYARTRAPRDCQRTPRPSQ